MVTFFMDIIKFLNYTIGCFLVALVQVSLGSFWATYVMQKLLVTDSVGVFGLDFIKLICFSELSFFWIILMCFFKSLLMIIVDFIYKERGISTIAHFFNHMNIIVILIILANQILHSVIQLFLLRRYYKTKNIHYLYIYFLVLSIEIALQVVYDRSAGLSKPEKIIERATNASYFGSRMNLLSISKFRDKIFFTDKKVSGISSNIFYKTLLDFFWINFMAPENTEKFLKKKTPIWTYILLIFFMIMTWFRPSPFLEVFTTSISYCFLCYLASKIFLFTRIRLFILLPLIVLLDMSYLDLLFRELHHHSKFICCTILFFLDYFLSYWWSEED